MKAVNIRVGDRIDGWTVTKYIDDHVRQRSGWQSMVLLTLEQITVNDSYLNAFTAETRRTWYRADEDVEVER